MKTIISKLFIKGDYDPLVFENPSKWTGWRSTNIRRVSEHSRLFFLQIGLQKHYAALQAIALDEPLEDIEDKTVPKFEMIDDVRPMSRSSH